MEQRQRQGCGPRLRVVVLILVLLIVTGVLGLDPRTPENSGVAFKTMEGRGWRLRGLSGSVEAAPDRTLSRRQNPRQTSRFRGRTHLASECGFEPSFRSRPHPHTM
jgi:hypothetical protein